VYFKPHQLNRVDIVESRFSCGGLSWKEVVQICLMAQPFLSSLYSLNLVSGVLFLERMIFLYFRASESLDQICGLDGNTI